jgi:sulfonate transport system substrate-binding protein
MTPTLHRRGSDSPGIVLATIAVLALLALASVLHAADLPTAPNAAAPQAQVVRIGYQRYGSLNILKAHGTLEQRLAGIGVAVQWSLFPAGPQLLEALSVGSIDVGSTGEAPPIFAQAAGVPLVYVSNEPANPASEAILVAKDSPIAAIKDLRGKRIALNKGSNVHYFLVKALEANGLSYADVQVVFLKPADARAAFEQGHVDAWAIWDPFLTAAKAATAARILVDGTGLVANREFFLAQRDFAARNRTILTEVLADVEAADQWALQQPRAVAEILAPDVGVDAAILEQIARRQARGVQAITEATIADQQRIADTFVALKLLPAPFQVRDATWLK